jgi:very-short-patch-repair endonuclease
MLITNKYTNTKHITPVHNILRRKTNCCFDNAINKQEYLISMSNIVHDNKYNYSKVNYKSAIFKIIITCPTHGDFKQTFNSHLRGSGCPRCSDSKGEKKIRKLLKSNDIIFIHQYKFNNCKNVRPLPFDFYLPDYNVCIEYNGKQHYEPIKHFGGKKQLIYIQKNDKIKQEFCEKEGIKLITVKYNEDIEERLTEELKNLSSFT